MVTLTEGRHAGEGLLFEADNFYSREEGTLLAGEVIVPGQVLGKVTVSGKYRAWKPANNDGSQNAVAVSYDPVDATSGDKLFCVIVRHAAWSAADLVMPSAATTGEKAAALAAIEAKGIIVR